MDIKATPNSHRFKAEQAKASEKKVQKNVSGNVKTRKKSCILRGSVKSGRARSSSSFCIFVILILSASDGVAV